MIVDVIILKFKKFHFFKVLFWNFSKSFPMNTKLILASALCYLENGTKTKMSLNSMNKQTIHPKTQTLFLKKKVLTRQT